MNITKKLLGAGLAGLMALSLTGCETGLDTKYIAQSGDTQVPAGIYLILLQNAYINITSELTDAPKEPLKATTADGVKVSDAVTQRAKDDLAKYLATEQKFKDLNLTVSDDDNMTTDYMMQSYWGYLGESMTTNGVAESSYRMFLDNMAKQNNVFHAIYGEGGEKAVPADEIKAYYKDNFTKILTIRFDRPTSGEVEELQQKEKELNDSIAKYEGLLKEGKSMKEVYLQYLKDQAEDPATVTEEQVDAAFNIYETSASAYEQEMNDLIQSAENGAYQKYDSTQSVYLFAKYDPLENESDMTARKETIISSMKNDEFQQDLLSWGQDLMSNVNSAALNRYTPEKLIMS